MESLLAMLYSHAPIWAQNLGISLYGLRWRHERLGGPFRTYVREFRERESWPAGKFPQYLEAELRTCLGRAFAAVPFYQQAWSAAGFRASHFARFQLADLPLLPITTKTDLRLRPADFVSREFKRKQRLHRYDTSGTTGTPITTFCTSDGHRRFTAAREARSFGWAGTSLLQPRSMIGGRLVVPPGTAGPPFHRFNWAEQQIYFSAFHISPANVPHYVSALNHYRPKVFTGYAHSHYLLAKMRLAQGLSLDFTPAALVLGSEKLTAEMKATLSDAFHARAYEEYGCVENCVLATECEHGRLHVSPDFGLLEIVDELGHAAPPGVIGRVLCTSLLNAAQPLVRYALGDLAAWAAAPCPCGRNHLPVLQEVIGRLEDTVIGPDGRQLVRFHGLFVGLPHVLEGQVIQEARDRFIVRVATSDDFNGWDEQQIHDRFVQRLGHVNLVFERVSAIPRTESGKFRAVISKVTSLITK
jgi:phenylacetate-CoA ligase